MQRRSYVCIIVIIRRFPPSRLRTSHHICATAHIHTRTHMALSPLAFILFHSFLSFAVCIRKFAAARFVGKRKKLGILLHNAFWLWLLTGLDRQLPHPILSVLRTHTYIYTYSGARERRMHDQRGDAADACMPEKEGDVKACVSRSPGLTYAVIFNARSFPEIAPTYPILSWLYKPMDVPTYSGDFNARSAPGIDRDRVALYCVRESRKRKPFSKVHKVSKVSMDGFFFFLSLSSAKRSERSSQHLARFFTHSLTSLWRSFIRLGHLVYLSQCRGLR